MIGCVVSEIAITTAAAAAHPGVVVLACRADVATPEAAAQAAEEGWRRLHARWHDADDEQLLAHPHVRAYRDLCSAVGSDPDRHPPSIQALVERGLRGRPAGTWPRINPVVDVVNVIAVRTLTSLGVFDANRVAGEIRLASTVGGEPFLALGARKPVALAADELMLRDDERVLSLFSRRDGVHQSVRPDTVRVVLLGCVVPGVERRAVADALENVHHPLARTG